MEIYLLKSAACLVILLLFYKLLLEKENMHNFKRFYLLSSGVAAVGIPFITFTTYVEPSAEIFNAIVVPSEGASESGSVKDYLPSVLIGIYFLGVLFFSIKFFRNLRHLIIKIRKNMKIKKDRFTNVLLSEITPPHTFFSFIFFNKEKYLNNLIPQDVKIHEQAHARQKHSLDVLFVELLQIFFWFNPLIFFMKNAIKLNHEFLADRAVIRQGISTSGYQQTLLSYSSGDLQGDLVNPINYSSIKKGFTVMKTKTSRKTIWVRSLLLLPLLGMLIYSCSTHEELEKPSYSNTTDVTEPMKATPEIIAEYNRIARKYSTREGTVAIVHSSDFNKLFSLYELMTEEQKATAETFPKVEVVAVVEDISATPAMVDEFNKLAKFYGAQETTEKMVREEDFKRMMYIFHFMTDSQRENAQKLPPPPPPAPAPSQDKGEVPQKSLTPVEVTGYPNSPPPPPSYEDLVEKGATFYYNGKVIEPEVARRLVEVEKKVNVQITAIDGKTEVRLTDKEQ